MLGFITCGRVGFGRKVADVGCGQRYRVRAACGPMIGGESMGLDT